jgi:hypothetical protein
MKEKEYNTSIINDIHVHSFYDWKIYFHNFAAHVYNFVKQDRWYFKVYMLHNVFLKEKQRFILISIYETCPIRLI